MKKTLLTLATILTLTLVSCDKEELTEQTQTEVNTGIIEYNGVFWDKESINKYYYDYFGTQRQIGVYSNTTFFLGNLERPVKKTHTITKNGIKYYTFELYSEVYGSSYYTIHKNNENGYYYLSSAVPGTTGYPDLAVSTILSN